MHTSGGCQEVSSRREKIPSHQGTSLFLLGLVQGCERFVFAGILPLFVLYLHEHHGLSEHAALLVFGGFQALCYLGALPAAKLTDGQLGCVPAALLGCASLTLGYGALALDRPALLWPALGLMVVGHGLFKPGLSALASEVLGATRREQGFLWLYLATNVGGMAGPLVAEYARDIASWRGVFIWATVSMVISTLLLVCRSKTWAVTAEADMQTPSVRYTAALGREQVRAVWLICGIAVIFWLTAQQPGSSLTLFAELHTQRHLTLGAWELTIGPGHFATLHSLLVLLLLPLCIWKRRRLHDRHAELSIPLQMIWGYVATVAAFAVMGAACLRGADAGRVHAAWLAGCYIFLSIAEVQLAPLGMGLVCQLAPPRKQSCAIGLWFASVALGNGLTGVVGLLWGRWPNHRYFAFLALLSLGAACVLWMRLRSLASLLRRTTFRPRTSTPGDMRSSNGDAAHCTSQ